MNKILLTAYLMSISNDNMIILDKYLIRVLCAYYLFSTPKPSNSFVNSIMGSCLKLAPEYEFFKLPEEQSDIKSTTAIKRLSLSLRKKPVQEDTRREDDFIFDINNLNDNLMLREKNLKFTSTARLLIDYLIVMINDTEATISMISGDVPKYDNYYIFKYKFTMNSTNTMDKTLTNFKSNGYLFEHTDFTSEIFTKCFNSDNTGKLEEDCFTSIFTKKGGFRTKKSKKHSRK
jgi:hypothetical protein